MHRVVYTALRSFNRVLKCIGTGTLLRNRISFSADDNVKFKPESSGHSYFRSPDNMHYSAYFFTTDAKIWSDRWSQVEFLGCTFWHEKQHREIS